MMQDKTFLIVGLGLMGGSYAKGLTKQGCQVLAIDQDPEAIRYATENGIIAEGGSPDEAPALLARADAIVLALYPRQIIPWLQAHRAQFKPGALVTDLAGVKSCFVAEAQELLAPWHEFIPCHPMAGREKSGVQNADETIFHGANFLLTPTAKNTQSGVDFAEELATTLGFKRITRLSPARHDEIIGYVSQLTHAIAVSLMNANDDPLLPDVTGDSFRDLTRIANMNAGLWSELFLANAPALTREIDQFTASLAQLRTALAAGDGPALEAMFRQSTQRRQQFGNRENA